MQTPSASPPIKKPLPRIRISTHARRREFLHRKIPAEESARHITWRKRAPNPIFFDFNQNLNAPRSLNEIS